MTCGWQKWDNNNNKSLLCLLHWQADSLPLGHLGTGTKIPHKKKRKKELLILFFESHVLVLLFKIFKLLWNSIAKLRPEVCGNQFWITPPSWVCSPVSVVLDIQRQAPELLSVQLEPRADLTHPHFYLLRSFILGTVTSVFQEAPWLGLPPKEWDQRTWNSTWFIVGAW